MRDLSHEQAIHCEGELLAKLRWNAELGPENIQRHGLDRLDIDHIGLDQVLLQVDLEDDRGIVGQGLVAPCKGWGGLLCLFHNIFFLIVQFC